MIEPQPSCEVLGPRPGGALNPSAALSPPATLILHDHAVKDRRQRSTGLNRHGLSFLRRA